MKKSKRASRATRTDVTRRAQLLAAFDCSGLSAAAFARQHGIHYTTFCGWRARRPRTNPSPAFVEVELAAPAVAAGLIVELGGQTRLRIESASQIALAAQLLQHLNASRSC